MKKWGRIRRITWLPIVLLLAVAVACGNEGGSSGTDRVEISLDELNGSGQSGTATLTASGGAIKVVLSLGEGTMKSGKVHIHNGQCGPDLKGVAHGLTDFTDGNSATTPLKARNRPTIIIPAKISGHRCLRRTSVRGDVRTLFMLFGIFIAPSFYASIAWPPGVRFTCLIGGLGLLHRWRLILLSLGPLALCDAAQ